MTKYIKRNGTPTKSNDPYRMVFCAPCGYWSDDFDKLPQPPQCPVCETSGFAVTADSFNKGALITERKEPGFCDFIKATKEKCMADQGGMIAAWKAKQKCS